MCQVTYFVALFSVKSPGLQDQPVWIQILALPHFSRGTIGNITSLNLNLSVKWVTSSTHLVGL